MRKICTFFKFTFNAIILFPLSLLANEVIETEPNNTYQEAQLIEVGDTFTFSLDKIGDFDFIKVKAPDDGVIRVTQLKESKTHKWVHPWWMINEKQYHRDGFWDVVAKKDEVLVIGLRSTEHAWDYKASDEKITVKITLEPHLTPEPNDNYGQATPIKIGDSFKLQINPRLDRDFFTFNSPGNGTVVIKQAKKSPAHGYLHPYWMVNAKQFVRDGEWSQRVAKDEKVVFGIRGAEYSWQEVGNAEVIELQTHFIPEVSTHEPNDTPTQAEQIQIGKEVTLMLAPRKDQDYFRVIAHDDGVIRIEQLNQPKEIGPLHPWWMINDKQYTRDGEFDQAVKKGEVVVFGLRANQYDFNEELSEEPIKIRLHFEKHAVPINNTYQTARPVKFGQPFHSQLMPRLDKDFFKVTAPGPGTIKLRQINQSKTHGGLYPGWMIDEKTYTRGGQWDKSVEAGESVIFFVQSAQYDSYNKASNEQITLLLTYTPEDVGAEPNNSMQEAKAITLNAPFEFKLNPQGDRDYFKFTAPKNGIVKLTRLDKTNAHPHLIQWWGETIDNHMISPRVMEKRLHSGEQTYLAFQSSIHNSQQVGSDATLQFNVEFIDEIDPNEPNDIAADATPAQINKPFSYHMIPADDQDIFSVTADADGVLIILGSNKKPLPHPAIWFEIGTNQWTDLPWINCELGKKYLVKILGNKTGYGSEQAFEAMIFTGKAEDFNLIPPTPRKQWSFDIKQAE